MTAPVVLALAMVLGALSFFEPCTIATHTLFSVRAHARRGLVSARELLSLWAARSLLSSVLLLVIVAVVGPLRFEAQFAGTALAVIASVYLVSRFVYIPVPHLEFWKLHPGGRTLPQAVQLGLTLPACTLPLFIIVTAATAILGSWQVAFGAGLLFATLFTAPTAVGVFFGVSESGRRFLHRAAQATPYITAALLYGVAIYLLV